MAVARSGGVASDRARRMKVLVGAWVKTNLTAPVDQGKGRRRRRGLEDETRLKRKNFTEVMMKSG